MVFPYKHPWKATLLGVALAIFIWLSCVVFLTTDQLQLSTRYTGRASGLLFLPVFIARPLVDIFGQARFGNLLRQRAALGLLLAGNHHVHMILLTVYLIGEGVGLTAFTLNPALYIYILLLMMNLTSFPLARAIFSRKTINLIHTVGLYALAIAFFETLVLSVFTGEETGVFRIGYSFLYLSALVIRITAFLMNKNRP